MVMDPVEPSGPKLAISTITPAAETAGAVGAVGVGTTAARSDHVHAMPSTFAPSGSAGGDLIGTYPNPTLKATGPGVTSATNASVTIDAQGRVTALSSGATAGLSLLYSQYASTTVTNTTTATTLSNATHSGSLVLPIGYFTAVGQAVRLRATGTWNATGTGNLTLGLSIGGAAITAGFGTSNTSTNGWSLEADVTCSVIGASGTLRGSFLGTFSNGSGTSTAAAGAIASVGSLNLSGATVTLDLTAQWSVASTLNIFTCSTFYLQPLN